MVYFLYIAIAFTVVVTCRVLYSAGYNKGFKRGAERILEEWKRYNNDDSNWN